MKLFYSNRKILFLILLFPTLAIGQITLASQSFNSGGDTKSIGPQIVSFTFGEPFVKSYENVQEGLFQYSLVITALEKPDLTGLKVYPLPFKNQFTIESDERFSDFTILTSTGQSLMNHKLTEKKQLVSLNETGAFFILKIYSKTYDKFFVFKIVKEN